MSVNMVSGKVGIAEEVASSSPAEAPQGAEKVQSVAIESLKAPAAGSRVDLGSLGGEELLDAFKKVDSSDRSRLSDRILVNVWRVLRKKSPDDIFRIFDEKTSLDLIKWLVGFKNSNLPISLQDIHREFCDDPALINKLSYSAKLELAQFLIDKGRKGVYFITEMGFGAEDIARFDQCLEALVDQMLPKLDDGEIDRLVEAENREALHELAYHRFSRKRRIELIFLDAFPAMKELQDLLINEDSSLSKIGHAMKSAREEQRTYFKGIGIGNLFPLVQTRRSGSYAQAAKKDPDELISISHGGGYFFIRDFLKGGTLGYRLEGSGFGLQVSTVDCGRDAHYADVGVAKLHCDLPGVITAKICAKYLDEAPNLYEAGLRSDFVPYLQNVNVIMLPVTRK